MNNVLKKLIVSTLLLFSFSIFSQRQNTKTTSLYTTSNMNKLNIDSLNFYFSKSTDVNDICVKLKSFQKKSHQLYKAHKHREAKQIALAYLELTDSLITKNNDDNCLLENRILFLNRLCELEKNHENYDKAYHYLIQIEKTINDKPIKDKINFQHQLQNSLNKAVIKNHLNMPQKAIEIAKETFKENISSIYYDKNSIESLSLEADITKTLADSYILLGKELNNASYLDSAFYFYHKSYDAAKIYNSSAKSAAFKHNIAMTDVLMARKDYEGAINSINNYKNTANGFDYKHHEYMNKAICYHALKNSDSAMYFAKKLIHNKKDKCRRSNLITLYNILSKEYFNLNEIDSAYKYSKLEITSFEKARKNKEKTFQLLYNNDFTEAKKLNSQIVKQEDANYKNKLIYIFSIIIIILLTYLYLVSKKKETNQIILDLKNNNVVEKTEKVAYNINEDFEAEILTAINLMEQQDAYLQADFSINKIAEKLETNSTYISFVFNKHKQETFKQYFTKKKISYIIDKLNTDTTYRKYSIQALAEEIGYSSSSAFTRAFKKQMNVTPSAYIKSLSK